MRRHGMRWEEGFEREKHGEFASGVWRFNSGLGVRDWRWKQQTFMSKEIHTVLVDHLPSGVSERELYKEFGKDGYISDIFISRKMRPGTTNKFAFIKYNSHVRATKSIVRMNGKDWGGELLHVTSSKEARNAKHRAYFHNMGVVVKEPEQDVVGKEDKGTHSRADSYTRRKEIEAIWSEEQR
ncbi:hypothetical protein PIB30_020325 [Stylosanthes scabra]|uniref:RRM domain-containing protein n=1 Tax=Stylosanthes scabra TaxID=79078 RepID=A0ABU6XAA4_9FABA|nr:hypothetical protein [Stylosanthes scabra]